MKGEDVQFEQVCGAQTENLNTKDLEVYANERNFIGKNGA